MFCGLELEADCELNCEKVRTAELFRAARGVKRTVDSCGRIMLEAVEAASLVRDAIVRRMYVFVCMDVVDTCRQL
jgi:hypothetical protein